MTTPSDQAIVNVPEGQKLMEQAQPVHLPIKKPHRDVYKTIEDFANACNTSDFKNSTNLLKTTRLKVDKDKFFAAESCNKYRRELIGKFAKKSLEHYKTAYSGWVNNNDDELYFLSAITFDLEKLKELVGKFKQKPKKYQKQINQTRGKDRDTVIWFLMKYINVRGSCVAFVECLKILIEAEVDMNRRKKGYTLLDHLALLYEDAVDQVQKDNLKKCYELLDDVGVFQTADDRIKNILDGMEDVQERQRMIDDDESSTILRLIVENSPEELQQHRRLTEHVNDSNKTGYKTFLQIACQFNHLEVVNILINHGANPNLTTGKCQMTPLLISTVNNQVDICKIFLELKETIITEEQYERFSELDVKKEIIEMFLDSGKIGVNYRSTCESIPLYSAINHNAKTAIHTLLKRGSSLVSTNCYDKRPLDIIRYEDLETCFDSCIEKDHTKESIEDTEYKLKINFSPLISRQTVRELEIVSMIGKNAKLEKLLLHPLVDVLVSLYWSKVKNYLYIFMFLQFIIFVIYLLLVTALQEWKNNMLFFTVLLWLTIALNVVKFPFIISSLIGYEVLHDFSLSSLLKRVRYTHKNITFHYIMEFVVLAFLFSALLEHEVSAACLVVEMAICLLLTVGYHPKLSKYSIMFQTALWSFILASVFFSCIIIGFGTGFHILFQNKTTNNSTTVFDSPWFSVFKTYTMSTGEFEISQEQVYFDTARCIFFVVFAMFVSIVIMNFWTGITVSDVEKIERNSEVNAIKNVIEFARIFDTYGILGLVDDRQYTVDWFINKKVQFNVDCKKFPASVGQNCINKVKAHCLNSFAERAEDKISKTLDDLQKGQADLLKQIDDIKTSQVDLLKQIDDIKKSQVDHQNLVERFFKRQEERFT